MELSNEEKIEIINNHLKNLAYTEYSLKISLIEAESSDDSLQTNIDNIKIQISSSEKKRLALQKEIDSLSTVTASE